MADLTTLERVKQHLGISGFETEDELRSLITEISAEVEAYCQRSFGTPASGSETLTGIDGDTIIPSRWPVVSVASLVRNGETIPPSSGYDVAGHYVDGNVVRLRGYRLETCDVVVMTYTAGAPAPTDLQWAVVQLVALAFNERKHVGTASVSLSGYATTFLPSMRPKAVEEILNRHRRLWPA